MSLTLNKPKPIPHIVHNSIGAKWLKELDKPGNIYCSMRGRTALARGTLVSIEKMIAEFVTDLKQVDDLNADVTGLGGGFDAEDLREMLTDVVVDVICCDLKKEIEHWESERIQR